MSTLYAVDGPDPGWIQYFRTRSEAFNAAIVASRKIEDVVCSVQKVTVGKLTMDLMIKAVNRDGWVKSAEEIATVTNGRLKRHNP
jgi:hypothetical protein